MSIETPSGSRQQQNTVRAPVQIDAWSLSAVPLELLCNGHVIGNATGFFWKKHGRIFLVSNWHVMSGRNPGNGQSKDKDYGAVPDHLGMKYSLEAEDGVLKGTIPLNFDNGVPMWRQHALHGQAADVALLEVTPSVALTSAGRGRSAEPFIANKDRIFSKVSGSQIPQSLPKLKVSPGMDVFVVGYPLGINTAGILPVWKRGSIASDYYADYNNLPCFLVDTATREGMSGAPVVLRSFGIGLLQDGTVVHGGPIFTQFLGVYSGRNTGKLGEADLGIVWKESVIEEIIERGVAGSYELR